MVETTTLTPATGTDAATPPIPFEAKRAARSLYWRGWSITQIAKELSLKYSTVSSWKSRHKWDEAASHVKMGDAVEARFAALVEKPEKSGRDFKEIDLLGRQAERLARIGKFVGGGNEADLNPNVANRYSDEAKAKRSRRKNAMSWDDIDKCRTLFENTLYGHQRHWWEASSHVFRFILKSRQIGATFYFAREAFMRAMDTGNNQIFLSASKNQSEVFRTYILDFVLEATGLELKGNPLIINRQDEDGEPLPPVMFYFLATNYRTAQSYHGDVYMDEVFWLPGFKRFEEVASGMAMQKQYGLTYFSTPSTVVHEAHDLWSGDQWNEGRDRTERRTFKTSHHALRDGAVGPDGIWRQIVTIYDAIDKGFDLIDVEAEKQKRTPEDFDNKLMCKFVDDTQSSFPFSLLQPAMKDTFYLWKDFKPAELRPFGNKPVWLGYDPNDQGRDAAQLMVIAPPETPRGKFRLLEKFNVSGKDYAGQAKAIKQIAKRYNVEDIAIENSAFGSAVFQLVVKWFPLARKVDYSVTGKAHMVMKAQNLFRDGRIQFPSEWGDVRDAFMAIHPSLTASGKQLTYASGRTATAGHADIAWATMHALINEPLDASEAGQTKATVEFFD